MRKVFISHRIGEPAVDALMGDLVASLESAGFDVLVDTERLQAGASLRQEVFTWMGVCHAAIVVLSPGALAPDSHWVPLESSVLAWRKTLDPDFVLIPVLLPGVTLQELRDQPRFAELGLDQLLHVAHADSATSCASIKTTLASLQPDVRSPLEDLAEQIEALLGTVRDDFLDEVVRLAKPQWQRPLIHSQKVRGAALALMEVPLAQALDALEYVSARIPSASHVDRILEIIAPGWVNLAAARWIAACATAQSPRLAAVINARTHFAAEMYVRRASCRPPRTMWRMVAITGVHGELAHEDIATEIDSALRVKFQSAITNDPFDIGTEDELPQLLREFHQSGRPVIVVLRLPQGGIRELMPVLQARFPYLTFVFLSGEELPDEASCPVTLVRRIEPALARGEEAEARRTYQLARSVLCP